MPRLVLPLVMAVLSLAAIAPAQAQGLPNPLGLRGYNLGMTLADARKLPHPDAELQKSDVKLGLTCTGEPAALAIGLALPPDSARDGSATSLCRFYAEDKDGIRQMPVNVGGHDAEVVLWFTPEKLPSATSARLYKIIVLADPANFDSLAEAYQSKFGKAKTGTIPGSNGSRPSRLLLWEDHRYELIAAQRMDVKGHTGGRTMIMYTYSPFEEVVKGMEKKKSGADKL